MCQHFIAYLILALALSGELLYVHSDDCNEPEAQEPQVELRQEPAEVSPAPGENLEIEQEDDVQNGPEEDEVPHMQPVCTGQNQQQPVDDFPQQLQYPVNDPIMDPSYMFHMAPSSPTVRRDAEVPIELLGLPTSYYGEKPALRTVRSGLKMPMQMHYPHYARIPPQALRKC